MRFQALARQGIQPVTYALDRALAYMASRESRAMLHELAQRIFPQVVKSPDKKPELSDSIQYTDKEGIKYLHRILQGRASGQKTMVVLRKEVNDSEGTHSKDWIGEIHPTGFNLRFGRTGRVNQNRFYKIPDCYKYDPLLELKRRAGQKMLEGYRLIPELSNF